MNKVQSLLFFLALFICWAPVRAAKKRNGQRPQSAVSMGRPQRRQLGQSLHKMQNRPVHRQQRLRQQKSASQPHMASSLMQGASFKSSHRRSGPRAKKQFLGGSPRQGPASKQAKGFSRLGGNKKSNNVRPSSFKREKTFAREDRFNRRMGNRDQFSLMRSKKKINNNNARLKQAKQEKSLRKRASGSKKESQKSRRERKEQRKEQRKQKREGRHSGRVQANSDRVEAAAHIAHAAKESPTAGLLDVSTPASASRIIPLAVDAHVGLGVATTPAGTAVGIYTGAGFGWFASPRFYGSGWAWQSPFWGPCHWYPRIGFWRVYGGSCWYNPWLGACLFPWDAMLISQGVWPAWVFPWYGCTLYSVPSYSGCIVRVDSGVASSLYCSVYYREPGSGFLIRYIEPRVVEGEIVKVVVPVRRDRYERVVVISQDKSSFKDSLPEKPDEDADYRYVMLSDPEDAQLSDDPASLEFEQLSDDELKKIAATNKAIDEKMDGKNFKKLEELRDLDLSDEDLEPEHDD